jgi:hypothetical protein
MSFINPAFLWAMFAVSIPIIIHLINFRRHKTLYFSNTRFLEDIRKETQTRTKLKHLLMLIARILTVAMLVIAFAGPFIPNNNVNSNKPSEVNVIYVDNSFSMESSGKSGQLFEQGRQIAKEIVFNSPASMRYLLITNDMQPEHQFVIGRDEFLRNLDKISISPSPLTLSDVVLKANTIIPENQKANLYVISDMQKSFLGTEHTLPADNISTVFIPITSAKVNNLFVDSAWFESPVHRRNMPEILTARIVNKSSEAFFDLSLQLYINDTVKALSGFSIEAGEVKDIEIEYINTTSGYVSARLEITDYPITYDNTLYFNYRIADITNILILNSGTPNRWLTALYGSDPENFSLTQIKAGTEQSQNLNSFDLIVLNSFSDVPSGLASQVQDFVSAGGSVLFIPSTDINVSSCNSFLSLFGAGKFETMRFTNTKIYTVEYDHELFRNVFIKKEKQSDLPVMGMVHKHVLFNASANAPVLKLDNGFPVLSGGSYGQGKIFIMSAPVSENNSAFMKSPLFVPAFYNMALSSQINNSLYATIKTGAMIDIAADIEVESSDIFRIKDSTNLDILASHRFNGKKLGINIPPQLKNAGTYELFKSDTYVAPVSLNYDRRESVPEYADLPELEKYISEKLDNRAKIIDSNKDDLGVELKEFAEGKPLWQLFILLAFLFICCEVAIARLMK